MYAGGSRAGGGMQILKLGRWCLGLSQLFSGDRQDTSKLKKLHVSSFQEGSLDPRPQPQNLHNFFN